MNRSSRALSILVNAASAHMGGAVTYLRNFLRWYPWVAPVDRLVVVVPERTLQGLQALGGPRVELVPYPADRTGGLARLYFDQVSIPRLVRERAVDVLFSSTGFGTYRTSVSQVLLVRNMAYFSSAFETRYREIGRSLRRNRLRRWHSVGSIRAADAVIFPTEAMRKVVGSYIDLSAVRTEAIHYGHDAEEMDGRSDRPHPGLDEAQRWKEAGHTILLNVSTYAIHKNFEIFPEALARMRDRGHKVVLVTTTSRTRTRDVVDYDAWEDRLHEMDVRDLVVEVGYTPRHRMASLYALADLYVFPSFIESFGHTLVEAMAAGLPIVAADTPVNREVCGAAAGVFFEPFDPASCAEAVGGLIEDPSHRRTQEAVSIERARMFSWEEHARSVAKIFRETVEAR